MVFNPSHASDGKTDLGRWQAFARYAGKGGDFYWTTKQKSKAGDFYVFWFGAPKQFVGGVGIHTGEFDIVDTEWGREGLLSPVVRLRRPVLLQQLKADEHVAAWWSGNPYRGKPKTMLQHPAAARRMLELILDNNPELSRLVSPYLESLRARSAQRPISKIDVATVGRRISALAPSDRERVYQVIRRAERDRRLRPAVLALWGTTCAACGISLEGAGGVWECEVAHVDEVAGSKLDADDVHNAFPLCRTHHWAFDQRLWAIDPSTCKIVVAPTHRKRTVLADLHGRQLGTKTRGAAKRLDRRFLEARLRALHR
jgi:hypothetical protein